MNHTIKRRIDHLGRFSGCRSTAGMGIGISHAGDQFATVLPWVLTGLLVQPAALGTAAQLCRAQPPHQPTPVHTSIRQTSSAYAYARKSTCVGAPVSSEHYLSTLKSRGATKTPLAPLKTATSSSS